VTGDLGWIVALGGNELNAGLAQVARRRRARLLVVDWNEAPIVAGDRHLHLDIKDTKAVLGALGPILDRVLFAYTSSDVGTETVARINAAKGFQRPPADALAAARYKPMMNLIWGQAGLLEKRFRACRSIDELCAFRDGLGGDLIVKPTAGSSSRGVTALRAEECDDDALAAAWARASAIDSRAEVLVEEFVHGIEYTVEMLGDGLGDVRVWGVSRKYHSPHAGRSRVATKLHYNPRELSRRHQLRIARFGSRCFKALGLRASLGHLEVIERPNGELVPIEIGARSSGFIATHLVDAINGPGPTLLDSYESVLRGGRVSEELAVPLRTSMYYFYDFPPGIGLRSGSSLAQFLPPRIRSVAHDRSRLRAGAEFAEIDSDFDRHGYEILVGDADQLTIDAVEGAEAAHRQRFLDDDSEATRSAAPAALPAALPAPAPAR
jgi:ATP-grasp domain